MATDTPIMMLRGYFFATSITRANIQVVHSSIILYSWWGLRRESFDGYPAVSIGTGLSGVWSSQNVIPAGETRHLMGDWNIERPLGDERPTLRGRACFVDQLGNEHWTRKLTFPHR